MLLLELRRAETSLEDYNDTSWPKIKRGRSRGSTTDVRGHNLTVLVESSSLGNKVFEITVSLTEGDALLDLRRYQAIVPASSGAGCSGSKPFTHAIIAKAEIDKFLLDFMNDKEIYADKV
ncbi:unnamed protein product, partial [marine sediment metagenome]